MIIKTILFSATAPLLAFVVTLSFSLSGVAGVEERIPTLMGQYRWKGEFVSAGQVDRQIVHEINRKETERKLFLQKNGYTCEQKPRQTSLCSRYMSLTQLPSAARELMSKQVRDLNFEAVEISKGYQVLVDGEAYKEYQVNQVVRFKGQIHPAYRVMLLPQVTKVVLGQPGGEYHSFVFENSQLQYWANAKIKHEFGWTEYLALAPLH